MFDISREKKIFGQRLEVQRVERLEGQWVERLEGWMLGRLEGLKVERQEKTSWKLIPSTIPSLYLPHKILDKWHSATYLPQNIQPCLHTCMIPFCNQHT